MTLAGVSHARDLKVHASLEMHVIPTPMLHCPTSTMAAPNHRAYRWIEVPWIALVAPSACLTLKCWCYDQMEQPNVMWECRRIIPHLYSHRWDKKLKLSKVLQKELKSCWRAFEKHTGEAAWQTHLKRSMLAESYRAADDDPEDAQVRNEFSMSTLAMLWMSGWLFARRTLAQGQQAAIFFLQTCAGHAGVQNISGGSFEDFFQHHIADIACEEPGIIDEHGRCEHVSRVLKIAARRQMQPDELQSFVAFIAMLMAESMSCKLCGIWAAAQLSVLSVKFDKMAREQVPQNECGTADSIKECGAAYSILENMRVAQHTASTIVAQHTAALKK